MSYVKKSVLGLLVVSSLGSCKLFLKTTGNYTNPKPETTQSIKNYMTSEAQYDGLYRMKSDSSLKGFVDSIGKSVPYVYVFDEHGINIYKNSACPWTNIAQLDSLKIANNWEVNTKVRLQDFSKFLILLEGKEPRTDYSYQVYFVWAKFVPKLSRDMLNDMTAQFKGSNGKIYIASVNLDFYQTKKPKANN